MPLPLVPKYWSVADGPAGKVFSLLGRAWVDDEDSTYLAYVALFGAATNIDTMVNLAVELDRQGYYRPIEPAKNPSVLVATTGDVDIASAPATIDTYTPQFADRVLVWKNTDAIENGIRLYLGEGEAMPRASDMSTSDGAKFARVLSRMGSLTNYKWTEFLCLADDNFTLDTHACYFQPVSQPRDSVMPGCRLSLASGQPVHSTNQTGSGNLFLNPYINGWMPVVNPSSGAVTPRLLTAPVGMTLSDSTKSPAAAAAGKVYDIFWWEDPADGSVLISRSRPWTTPAIADRLDAISKSSAHGFDVNTDAITNGPDAGMGIWVGTIYTNAAAATLDFDFGGEAAGGSPGNFGVWNVFNRRKFIAEVRDSTDSWTLAAGSIRKANNSDNMRVRFVQGRAEDTLFAAYQCSFNAGSGGTASVGVCWNNTNAFDGPPGFNGLANLLTFGGWSTLNDFAGGGFVSAVEQAITATASFYGDIGVAYAQNALRFEFHA